MSTIARSTALTVVLALGLVGAPALAQDTDVREVTVEMADLDLTTAAGQKTLDARLRAAFRTVCRPVSSASWRASIAARDCRTKLREHYKPMRDAAVARAHIEASRLGLVTAQR